MSQGTETHEELSIRSVAFYNARTMNYTPPTENDILDITDADYDGGDDDDDDASLAPVPSNIDDGDIEGGTASPQEDTHGDIARPVIDQDEEDQMILNNIQNADDDNCVYNLEELTNYIDTRNLNLRLGRQSSRDGNCLFDSLAYLVTKYEIENVPRCHKLLRRDICNSVTKHPQFPTWMAVHFKRPVVFQLFLENMRRNGTYSDNMGLIVAASAHFLGNDFIRVFGRNPLEASIQNSHIQT